MENPRTLLIDADILLYKAASSVENEVEFEEDIWVLWTDENEAIEAFNMQVADLLEQAKTYSYLLCFSHADNYRKNMFPDYKANRKQRKPMGFKAIKQRLLDDQSMRHKIINGIEADDIIGIFATEKPDKYIIWSADKDLRQIPGRHLIDGYFVDISQEDADLWFYTQMLTGDTVDNYKGCPGIGPVKAATVLLNKKEDADMWTRVVNAYLKAGLTEADALLNARLARILRTEDWNYETNEVKLWSPNIPSR